MGWKPKDIMIPTLSSVVASEVVFMTTLGATSDEKVGIMTTPTLINSGAPNDKVGTVTTTVLTHWGRLTHTCIGNLTIIVSDSGLRPGQRKAIISTTAGILLTGPLGTDFSEILIEIITFSFKKMCLNVSSAKQWPFCLSLKMLRWPPGH